MRLRSKQSKRLSLCNFPLAMQRHLHESLALPFDVLHYNQKKLVTEAIITRLVRLMLKEPP